MARERNAARAVGRWTEREARAVLEAWQRSGKSGAAFARQQGIDPQRLFWWRERLGLPRDERARPGNAFVPVVVTEQSSDRRMMAVSVSLPGDARLEVHELSAESAAWVALVVGAVAGGGR
jgi:hypothetical protein